MALPMRVSSHLHVLIGEVWLLPKELCGSDFGAPQNKV